MYFDKIEMRLSDVKDLGYGEGLYMLRIMLEGYRMLVARFGWFRVVEDMVFFSSEGDVYVWINPNVSSMTPYR